MRALLADLLYSDAPREHRYVGVRRAVGVGEAVAEDEPVCRVGLEDLAIAEAQPLEIGADDSAASAGLLRDQAGPLEHRDVLLDRPEAHRVMAGQLDDAAYIE